MQQTTHTHGMDGWREVSAVYAADSSHSQDGRVGVEGGVLCMQQAAHTHRMDGWGWREESIVYAADSSHSHDGWREGSAVYAADNSHSQDGWVGVEGGECCVCSRQLTLT